MATQPIITNIAATLLMQQPSFSNQPSPITDLEHRFALALYIAIYKDIAKGCSKSAIGDG